MNRILHGIARSRRHDGTFETREREREKETNTRGICVVNLDHTHRNLCKFQRSISRERSSDFVTCDTTPFRDLTIFIEPLSDLFRTRDTAPDLIAFDQELNV